MNLTLVSILTKRQKCKFTNNHFSLQPMWVSHLRQALKSSGHQNKHMQAPTLKQSTRLRTDYAYIYFCLFYLTSTNSLNTTS